MKAKYSVYIRSISETLYVIRWKSLAMILRCTIAGIHFQYTYKYPASQPLPPIYSLMEGKTLAKMREEGKACMKRSGEILRGMPLCYTFASLKPNTAGYSLLAGLTGTHRSQVRDATNFFNRIYPMEQKTLSEKPQERLENKETRSTTITLRTTPKIKARLQRKAKACKMPLSSYIHSLVCGYEPKAAITPEQEKLLEHLIGARNDVKNISNALKYLPRADKLHLFGNEEYMRKWLTAVDKERVAFDEIIDSLTNPNSL